MANCDADPGGVCETDLRISATHCGACGRACGGSATCLDGECSIEILASGRPQPFGLELSPARAVWLEPSAVRGCRLADCAQGTPPVLVDIQSNGGFAPFFSAQQLAIVGDKFYFSRCPSGSTQDCGVASCAVGGCKLEGAPFLTASPSDRRARVVSSGPGAIYTYSSVLGNGFLRTALANGALSNPPTGAIDYFQGVYVDANDIVYVDDNPSQVNPTGGLYRCPATGCVSGTPRQRLLPSPIKHVDVFDRTAFVSSGLPATSSILSCGIDGCDEAGTVLATTQAFVSSIVADATAVYWTTTGTATPLTNTAAIGSVMRCALPACAGGPSKVAENLVNPVSVRVDADYVYWMTYGSNSSPTGTFARKRR